MRGQPRHIWNSSSHVYTVCSHALQSSTSSGGHAPWFVRTHLLLEVAAQWLDANREENCLPFTEVWHSGKCEGVFFPLGLKIVNSWTRKHPSFSWLILIWIIFNNCSLFNPKRHCIKYMNFWTLHDSWCVNWTGLVHEHVTCLSECAGPERKAMWAHALHWFRYAPVALAIAWGKAAHTHGRCFPSLYLL